MLPAKPLLVLALVSLAGAGALAALDAPALLPGAPGPGPGHANPAARAPGWPLAAGAGLGLAGDGAAAAGQPLVESATFSLIRTAATATEINLGVAPNGHVFVGGWNAVYRSSDDGATWQRLNAEPWQVATIAADRVLIVDHDTGRVIKDDTSLACTTISWSDDDGATWLHTPLACGGGVTDHQKIAVGKRVGAFADPTGLLYPNLMYACANGLAAANCGVSPDGGLAWLTTTPHGIGCAFQGAPVSDANGALYEPTTQCGAQIRKTANAGLTWTNIEVAGATPSADTPDMAVTPDGSLYFFYTDSDWHPALARSLDGGETWDVFAVNVPGLVSSVFPSIVAGQDGRIALSFYATPDDDEGWNHNPGDAPDAVRWFGYVAVVADAASAAPTIQPLEVTGGDPLQLGCLSKLGGCLGNIADYMDIDVGPDGRAWAVFVDGCEGCTDHASSDKQVVLVAKQTGGTTL
jgi:hypothetical protein